MADQRSREKAAGDEHARQTTLRRGPSVRAAGFAHRALVVVGITAAAVVLLFLIWSTLEALLLLFAGLLLALFLGALADWLSAHTPIGRGWALAAVTATLAGLFVLLFWLSGPAIARQVRELQETLPAAVRQLESRLSEYRLGEQLVTAAPSARDVFSDTGNVFSRITGVFSATLGLLANLGIILLMGIFLAAQPGAYLTGLVSLIAPAHRPRVRAALEEAGHAMRQWLVSKVLRMAFIGAATWLALRLLGVPVPLLLGVIAALLSFVPNFGPISAAIPAVLLALLQGPRTALLVAGLYVVIQVVEGNVLDPLLTKAIVRIPPALTFGAQILLGVLVGPVGIAVATPLTAAATVLVRRLYVEGVLEAGAAGRSPADARPAGDGYAT